MIGSHGRSEPKAMYKTQDVKYSMVATLKYKG